MRIFFEECIVDDYLILLRLVAVGVISIELFQAFKHEPGSLAQLGRNFGVDASVGAQPNRVAERIEPFAVIGDLLSRRLTGPSDRMLDQSVH